MNESCSTLSCSNKRQLAKYKSSLCERLRATVIYPEDRLVILKDSHADVLKELKRIDRFLKKRSGTRRLFLPLDVQLFRLRGFPGYRPA